MELLLKKGGFSVPKIGDVVQGTVLEQKRAQLFIDLGVYGTGIVFGREFRAASELIKKLNPGDQISGKVVEFDNEEGYVELSLKEAGADQSWTELKKMAESGDIFELPVIEANRGGLMLELKGVKGFLPASQLSQANYPRVEGGDKEKIFQELQKLAGKTLKVKILDLNPAEQKLIFTEKSQTLEELRHALGKYKMGDIVEGEITGVVDFGAFMKFDKAGLEGLIHISEIDWTLIENPREVLKPGDRMQAKIIDIQADKVSLSLKQTKEDPWSHVAEKYHKGDTIKGKVTKFNTFGAFVALDSQIQGLVHISEFGTEDKMREILKLGKEYEFKVLLLEPKEHRMSLGVIREEKKKKKNEEE
ncbi:MAG: S1 RNA-binding domain-containing protein, partial [Candidatus Portnoybacteria bacterium]|nr:S1 RNA-binding domain-containing protein [Candidatus Portnoybacteria bacterium]